MNDNTLYERFIHLINIISEKNIKEIAVILKQFNGDMVVIIPGNHDFHENTDKTLWSKFNACIDPEKIIVLNEYEIFDHQIGEHKVNFFPASCRSKHSEINMIGWVEKDKAEFVFFVFSNGFNHQYDCYISYFYDFKRKKLGLKISEFKFPPFSN